MKSDIHMIVSNKHNFPVDPKTISLRPEEKLLSADYVQLQEVLRPISAVEALRLLAGVDLPEDIGKNGPVVAARVFPQNESLKELRLYEVLFGRDSLIVAMFVFLQYPELTRTTVLRLAQLQGVQTHSASEEEPGKIPHEVRAKDDPMAKELTARHGWEWPYYGTIDATLLFVRAIVRYAREKDVNILSEQYADKEGKKKTILDALQAAVSWTLHKMDQNPEGLVESLRLNKEGGNINQCWKDAYDSYHHADGSLANKEKGVASIEVQALAYDALLDVVDLYKTLESEVLQIKIVELEKRAITLRTMLFENFWVEDDRGGYFALGSDRDIDGKLRILRVRSSNMGHLLDSRLLDGEEKDIVTCKEKLVETLFSPEMVNVSGIRTLSTLENRYRPNSYHNGSVWLWDTFQISLGLLRQGYDDEAEQLREKILNVVHSSKRFPEFVSGAVSSEPIFPDRLVKVADTKNNFEHFIEQPPQEIQAWTVAAVVAIEDIH